MTGNGDVLKAHSAMASITSWKKRKTKLQFSHQKVAEQMGLNHSSKVRRSCAFKFSCSCSVSGRQRPLTRLYARTLNGISDVMVNPCVMTGSSSAVRPFHTSNSTQRHPARRTCRYISTEELPASWPAATQRARDVTAAPRPPPRPQAGSRRACTCQVGVVRGVDDVVG